MSDLKFLAALAGGFGCCLTVALFAILLLYCMARGSDAEPDDFMKGVTWLLAAMALSVALYVWGQS